MRAKQVWERLDKSQGKPRKAMNMGEQESNLSQQLWAHMEKLVVLQMPIDVYVRKWRTTSAFPIILV